MSNHLSARCLAWTAAFSAAVFAAVVPGAGLGAGVSLGCQPQSGLGSVALVRNGGVHVVDLANCRDRMLPGTTHAQIEFAAGGRVRTIATSGRITSRDGRFSATVRATGKKRSLRDTIWVTNVRNGRAHAVYTTQVQGDTTGLSSPGPIELLGWSGDARWLFFAIDPGSSASIAADGLVLRVVPSAGGAPHKLGVMLAYPDYLTWCGGRLVFTAGRDRIAINAKRLLVASPPTWRTTQLVQAGGRSFGSLACAPDNRSLVAQTQPSSTNADFFATRWSLWRIGLDGSQHRLTSPPPGFADASPRFSRDGETVMFVRSRKGNGKLYALESSRLLGPLLSLGYSLGYYGHQDWWQTMAWSQGETP